MPNRRLIVTHHAPDLDAIGSVWLLKRFDTQHYATAQVKFVNPGETLSEFELQDLGYQPTEITHVDTGGGEFDHHQPERAQEMICASSLVYDYILQRYPDQEQDETLKQLVAFITEIDHFQEVFWPEAGHYRYTMMLHELIKGQENINPHDDDSILQFGLSCLDAAYAQLKLVIKAESLIEEKGQEFETRFGRCLAIMTENDDTIKVGQKQGYLIVVRKDSSAGNIRIKARPDADLDLKPVADKIKSLEPNASWFYHHSGKMLLNGSSKHRNQQPSQLTLPEIIGIIQETYGKQ